MTQAIFEPESPIAAQFGTAVLEGTPKRPLTDPASIVSETREGTKPVPLADLCFARTAYFAAWTPDGRHVVLTTDITGRMNLWKTPLAGGFPQQLQQSDNAAFWPTVSPDGKTVVFGSDVGGREIFALYATPLDGGETVKLTHVDGESFGGPYVFSPDSRLIALRPRVATEPSYNVAVYDVASGVVHHLTREAEAKFRWGAVAFSPDGKSIFANRQSADSSQSQVWRIDVASGAATPVTHGGYEAATALSPDGRSLAITSQNAQGLRQALLLDLETGARRALAPSPWPQIGGQFSPDGRFLTAITNEDGRERVHLCDLAAETERELNMPPGKLVDPFDVLPAWSPDSKRLLVPHNAGNRPADLWTYEIDSGHFVRITDLALASVNPQHMPPTQIVTYASFDGTPVSAILWMPFNLKRDGSAPVAVHPHGGPTWQTFDSFDRTAAALASRGYIVIAPNVRGSTGYGAAFERANRGDLGGRDLEDTVGAARFLIASGYADPKRIGIYGHSYGGYMTIMAVGKTPGVWAAAVEICGVVNWHTMWTIGSPATQIYQHSLIGHPEEDAEVYRRVSPLTYLPNATAPMLVLQGANDIRVPRHEAEQVVDTLEKSGCVVEAKYYAEEGHSLLKRENQIDMLERLVAWFDLHLKG